MREAAFSPMAFAASDLGARLAETMRAGSASQRKMAEIVLRHPMSLAAGSIEDAARHSGISAPTISRFARELGFAGFAEFRQAIAETLQSLLQPVEKLRGQIEAHPGAEIAPFEAPLLNLSALRETVAPDEIHEIAARIAEARTVYIMGFGLSAHVAGLLMLGLQPFCNHVINAVEFGGTEVAAGKLVGIQAGDLLVAISVPRYARDIVDLMRFALDRSAYVVAITDSPASPLVAHAKATLYAPSEHPVMSSSMVALVAVVEALVSAVMVSSPENVAKARALTEAISGYLHGE